VLNVVLGAVGGLMALATPGLRGPGMFGGSTHALPGMRPEAKPAPDSVPGKLDTLGRLDLPKLEATKDAGVQKWRRGTRRR
jgi:hypothetical protein